MVKFIFLTLIVISFMIISLQAREITIAVVKDGPSSEEQLVDKIEIGDDSITSGCLF